MYHSYTHNASTRWLGVVAHGVAVLACEYAQESRMGGQGLSGLAAQEEQRKRYPRQDVKRHRHAGTAQRSISKTSHAPKSGKGALERRLSVEEFNAVLERP